MTDALPSGWSTACLGDLFDVLDHLRVPVNANDRATRRGDVPYYGATGQVGWIDGFLFDEELILLGEDGAPFLESNKPKAYVIRGRSWVNNHAHVLRAPFSTPSSFWKHQLDTVSYSPFVSGTTRLKLPQGRMKQIPLLVPPPEEQCRLAEALDSYVSRLDDAVASLERVQTKLKAYRASVLKAAVEGSLVPTEASLARAEKRPYESAELLLARIIKERQHRWEEAELAKLKAAGQTPKDDKWKAKYVEPGAPNTSRLIELPEGWCWATMSALLSEPLRNGHSAREAQDATGIRTLTLSAVTEADFGVRNTKLTVAEPNKVADLWLRPGDIFVERSNTPELVGLAALYQGEASFAVFPDLLIRVRCTRHVMPEFIEAVLLSSGSRRYFQRAAQGIAGTMPKISQGTIEALAVPLPPLAEQQRIVDELQRLRSVAVSTQGGVVRDQLRCLRLRQAVLKWAFEGKLVDQDPRDEPAERLLARIQAQCAAAAPKKSRGRTTKGAA